MTKQRECPITDQVCGSFVPSDEKQPEGVDNLP